MGRLGQLHLNVQFMEVVKILGWPITDRIEIIGDQCCHVHVQVYLPV